MNNVGPIHTVSLIPSLVLFPLIMVIALDTRAGMIMCGQKDKVDDKGDGARPTVSYEMLILRRS